MSEGHSPWSHGLLMECIEILCDYLTHRKHAKRRNARRRTHRRQH